MDAAIALLAFFRRRDAEGQLVHTFHSRNDDGTFDTRFLGDLYQDLSEAARKRYALLQTPEFVEEFILDLTLTPALEEFGLEGFKLIDPTCGSGHFLLGAFRRLLDAWAAYDPAIDTRTRIDRALNAIHGVDVNPFATGIAKFRLIVAALSAEGLRRLDTAPAYRLHVGTGDALLWEQGKQGELSFDETGLGEHQYATEDLHEHPDILRPGRYHVVVGNPPYITVKDKALNEAYRDAYASCAGTYALTVPFAELFFRLSRARGVAEAAGFVGQITSNAFAKREFGKKLVESFFGTVTLSHVIDTSGAYIPGHGTPTVILVGRRRHPSVTDQVRAVLGIRGEPDAPKEPSQGRVWTSILENLDRPGATTDFVTVSDIPRSVLASHPWSLAGGGASSLLQQLQGNRNRLHERIEVPVGRSIRAGADEAFVRPRPIAARARDRRDLLRPLLVGDVTRDWLNVPQELIWYPYERDGQVSQALQEELWPWRTPLRSRRTFQGDMAAAGLHWWEYMQHTSSAYRTPLSVAFAFVATHNHFVLDRGGKVFKQSAPVIKLPAGASEDDHLRLLGLLNSSTACFWLKQVSHNKGSTVDAKGARQTTVEWENFYEFTGTKLQEFPLPNGASLRRARALDALAQRLAKVAPSTTAGEDVPTHERFRSCRV